jgi:O-antigen ligase
MCVGIFFFFNKKKLKNTLSIIIILSAVVLTFTRGFLLSIILVGIVYLLFIEKKRLLVFGLGVILILLSLILIPIYMDSIGDKSSSDSERFIQTNEVFERVTPLNVFLGAGFGQGVPARPIHMEISFLEIFRKQGIMGLFFWFYLLFATCISFYKADKFGNRKYALPFLLATIFVYFQTMTNPFLNNPIGMSVVLISLVVLKRLETINFIKE